MLYNICHVMLYDMFKIEQNRACYITCHLTLSNICHIMLFNILLCYITCVVKLLYNTCHVMLYDMFKIEQNMLYNMCHLMLYHMSCYVI